MARSWILFHPPPPPPPPLDEWLVGMEVITDVELCRCDVSIELAFLPVATILTPVKKKSLQGTATVIGHLPADLDLVLVGLNNLHHRSSWWHLIKKKNNTKIIINCNTPNRSTCSTIQTIDWFVFFFWTWNSAADQPTVNELVQIETNQLRRRKLKLC